MQIIPDPVFAAWMTLPFIVTLVAMWALLFKPFRAYLDEREEATIGARHEAERLAHATDAKLADLEARLIAARQEAGRARAEHRDAALAHEQQVLEAARRDAEARLAEALQQIGAEREAARQTLRETAAGLSRDIATQVLGRPVEGRA